MASPFLKLVSEHIYRNYKDNIENLCIVLPNKRGALFLKQYLAQSFGKTIWLPTIISAEEFISEISGLKSIEEIDLLCFLYQSYSACYGEKAEPFDSFARWGQLILQDFNEIDRYLADSEQLYENLREIKVIENWSLGEENLSQFQVDYIEFMNSLGAIYKHFSDFLLQNKFAYQGLAYRQAVKNISTSAYPGQFHKLIFAGFNALNAAEIKIFDYLHQQKKADILWDSDEYYVNNSLHEAGLFLRRNLMQFGSKNNQFTGSYFKEDKQVNIISVPKQIGQAQVVKQAVQEFIDKQIPLDKVAIVLANEKLLWPVLQQLPEQVQFVNITMEYPLRYTSSYALIDSLLQIQFNFGKQTRKQKNIYYKDFISLLQQPLFNSLLQSYNIQLPVNNIINELVNKNISFITGKIITQFFNEKASEIIPLFSETHSMPALCSNITGVLNQLLNFFLGQKSNPGVYIELEYLNIIIKNLNRLYEVVTKYPHFNNIKAFRQLFNQVVGSGSASFIGEPLRGLQIMGVLETRTLDFEHLIFVNVNEGVLPSGKSINSFIPNDLKRAFGLPLYLEKDAIYSYHFYRLLQRAVDITITYDSETDAFGKGEKSRFITQLQLELKNYNPNITITESVANTSNVPAKLPNNIEVQKTDESLNLITQKAVDNSKFGGLSPSGLLLLKECTLKFYFRYGAGLKELKKVEESAESNTFGSILHLSLESIYKDFTGKTITADELKLKLQQIDAVVKKSFSTFFESEELSGKNVLQFEVIKIYVEKLVKNDLGVIEILDQKKQQLKLIDVERELCAEIEVKTGDKKQVIFIKGKADRIDLMDKETRVIDYKSSVKATDKFEFTGFEDLFEDLRYNKQFQLMMYAWLLFKNKLCKAEDIRPGIIPFKEFSGKPVYITTKDKKPFIFSEEILFEFEEKLIAFIESIFDKQSPFLQTQEPEICQYCSYNLICNRH